MNKLPLGLGNPILMPLNLNSAWIILRRILNRSLRSCLFFGIRYLVFFPHFRRMSWKQPSRKRWSKVRRPKCRGAKKETYISTKALSNLSRANLHMTIFSMASQARKVKVWSSGFNPLYSLGSLVQTGHLWVEGFSVISLTIAPSTIARYPSK